MKSGRGFILPVAATTLLIFFTVSSNASPPLCQAEFFGGNQFRSALMTSSYRAVEVVATVRVDSLWNTYDEMRGHMYSKKLSVLSVAEVDTSIFTNDTGGWAGAAASQFSYDTALFKKTLLDTTSGQWLGVTQGDTLRNAFILQEEYPDYHRCFWSIMVGTCAFCSQDAPPISIGEVLAAFNAYLQKNNIYRGYDPPAGPLKLGPVFKFLPVDCGWSLRAYSDTGEWFIVHMVGAGDCPVGCNQITTTLYSVSSAGIVSPATDVVNRKPATRTPVYPPTGFAQPEAYDFRGRRVAGPGPAVNDRLPTGVYLVRESGNRLAKRLIAY